jgi:branched-chain amino acid aminotransferase
MILYLNGNFIPESEAAISVYDRGFLYGDGLFETVRIVAGRPYKLIEHLQRLQSAAAALDLQFSGADSMPSVVDRLLQFNNTRDSLLRITLTRGPGKRGYSPKNAGPPTILVALHPLPENHDILQQWHLILSTHKAADPFGAFKTCSKLLLVLARAQADRAGADDALLLHLDGTLAETTTSNIFWICDGALCTPPLTPSILPGVTRQTVINLARDMNIPVAERTATPADLFGAEAVLLTQTTFGIIEAVTLDQRPVRCSPQTNALHRAYMATLPR